MHLDQRPAQLIIDHKTSLTFGDSVISSEEFGTTYASKWNYLECVAGNGFACILMTK